MKIWIDFTNSPHVNFFAAMIEELRKDHEIIMTCRPLANTIDLLELKGYDYHIVGSHYGASKLKKILGFWIRVLQLVRFLKGRHVDVAISHSSFYSPVAARLLGIRSIYINDNEHAEGNKIAFLCASTIMVPEFLSMEKVKKQWADPKKVIHYPGVKEGVYLSALKKNDSGENTPRPSEIFIRPEPWNAQYYHGALNFLDELIIGLKDKYSVVLIPRGQQQVEHYHQEKFRGITIPDKMLSLEMIAERCALFIGAGGTMTREAAVLGIPTISIYQDELLDVDRYLIAQERMIHNKEVTVEFVEKFLSGMLRKAPSVNLIEKGATASRLIVNTLLNSNEREK